MAVAASGPSILVRVDPVAAEAAVRHAMSNAVTDPDALAAHGRRSESLYAIHDDAGRDAGFGRLALAEFDELALAAPIRQAIAERPAVASRVRIVLIGEAGGRHEEGITCEPGGEHLGVRVDVAKFADPGGLLAWVRHALGHAEDTLDPSFRFVPGWEEGTGTRLRTATQARLHRLWDVTVDARLVAAGRLAAGPTLARHRERMAADLAGASQAAITAAIVLLWDGPRPTFPDLLAWAIRPAALIDATGGDAVVPRPDHCPLCRFPSDDVLPPPSSIAELVMVEYPDWRPELGLCGRCGDRYRFARRLGGR